MLNSVNPSVLRLPAVIAPPGHGRRWSWTWWSSGTA